MKQFYSILATLLLLFSISFLKAQTPTIVSTGLEPTFPEVYPGESFIAKYQILNPTGQDISGYLIFHSREPGGWEEPLLDGNGNAATAVVITPGTNWYTRSCVVNANDPPGLWGGVYFISPTTGWGDNWDFIRLFDIYQVLAGDPYEPNNSFSEATDMDREFDISAYINPLGDEDYFKIPLSEAGLLTIDLTSLPDNYDLYFYDPDQVLIESSTNEGTTSEQIQFSDIQMSGYYYIQIVGVNNAYDATDPYQLTTTWETETDDDPYEPNNTSSTAYSMPLEFSIDDAYINPVGDEDWFKVPISGPGTYTIDLTSLPANYNLYFFDPNLLLLASSTAGGTNSEQIVFSNFTMIGYYYIKVAGNWYGDNFNASDSYELSTSIKYKVSGYAKSSLTTFDRIPAYIRVDGEYTGVQTDENGYYEVDVSTGLHTISMHNNSWEWVEDSFDLWIDGNITQDFYGQCTGIPYYVLNLPYFFIPGEPIYIEIHFYNYAEWASHAHTNLDISFPDIPFYESNLDIEIEMADNCDPQIYIPGMEICYFDIDNGTQDCNFPAVYPLVSAYNEWFGVTSWRYRVKVIAPDEPFFTIFFKCNIGDKHVPNDEDDDWTIGQQGLWEREKVLFRAPQNSITGRAISSLNLGDGIPGATVTIDGDPELSCITDQNGNYSTPEVYWGNHTITITHDSYEWVQSSFNISMYANNFTQNFYGTCKAVPQITYNIPSSFMPGQPFTMQVTLKNIGESVSDVSAYLDVSFPDLTNGSSNVILTSYSGFDEEPAMYTAGTNICKMDMSTGAWDCAYPADYLLVSGFRTDPFSANQSITYTLQVTPPDVDEFTIHIKGNIGDRRNPDSGTTGQQGLWEKEIAIQLGWGQPTEIINVDLFGNHYVIKRYLQEQLTLIYEKIENNEVLIDDISLAESIILYHLFLNKYLTYHNIDTYKNKIEGDYEHYKSFKKSMGFRLARVRVGNAALAASEIVLKTSIGIPPNPFDLTILTNYIVNNFKPEYDIYDQNNLRHLYEAYWYFSANDDKEMLANMAFDNDLNDANNFMDFIVKEGNYMKDGLNLVDILDDIDPLDWASFNYGRTQLNLALGDILVGVQIEVAKILIQNFVFPDVGRESLILTQSSGWHAGAITMICSWLLEDLASLKEYISGEVSDSKSITALINKILKEDVIIRQPLKWELWQSYAFHLNNIKFNAPNTYEWLVANPLQMDWWLGTGDDMLQECQTQAQIELNQYRIEDYKNLQIEYGLMLESWKQTLNILNSERNNALEVDIIQSDIVQVHYGENNDFILVFKNKGSHILESITIAIQENEILEVEGASIINDILPGSSESYTLNITGPDLVNDDQLLLESNIILLITWQEQNEFLTSSFTIPCRLMSPYYEITASSFKDVYYNGDVVDLEIEVNTDQYLYLHPILKAKGDYIAEIEPFEVNSNNEINWTIPETAPKGIYDLEFDGYVDSQNKVLDNKIITDVFVVYPPIVGDLSNFNVNSVSIISSANDYEIAERLRLAIPESQILYADGLIEADLHPAMQNNNLILVGGDQVNLLVDKLVTLGKIPSDLWINPGDAHVIVLDDPFFPQAPSGNKVIVVAGYDLEDTYISGLKLIDALENPTQIVSTPFFDHSAPFIFNEPINVNLSCETPDAIIHYTTDGTEPNEDSPVGSSVEITTSTLLKAKAFKPDWEPSILKEGTYILSLSNHTIDGQVIDQNQEGMPDISLELTGYNDLITQTDVNGYFQFVNVPAGGTYSISPSDTNLCFIPEIITISDLADDTTINFQLNSKPDLLWEGLAGYLNDGVDPNTGFINSTFNFRIKYIDTDDHEPLEGYPRLIIRKDSAFVGGNPFVMLSADTNDPSAGRIYYKEMAITEAGNYTYYFQAVDEFNATAEGIGTVEISGPTVIIVPKEISILEPTQNDYWALECQYEIKWNDNFNDSVTIDLYKGGIFNNRIKYSANSDGNYLWNVPDYQVAGDDYTIKISCSSDEDVYDFSDVFSIGWPPLSPSDLIAIPENNQVSLEYQGPDIPINNDGLHFEFLLNKYTYLPGENIYITVYFNNNTDQDFETEFSSSCIWPTYIIPDYYNSADEVFCLPIIIPYTVHAHTSIAWDFVHTPQDCYLPPGIYTIQCSWEPGFFSTKSFVVAANEDELSYSLTTNKIHYLPGEPINLNLNVTNPSEQDTVSFFLCPYYSILNYYTPSFIQCPNLNELPVPSDSIVNLWNYTHTSEEFFLPPGLYTLSATEPQSSKFITVQHLTGYNIYRDGIKINDNPVLNTQYLDNEVINGTTYTYYVTALYGNKESPPSNQITITPLASYFPGDANCDGTVNVLDIVTIINYIMGQIPSPFCFEAADVNNDQAINVLDIVQTINIIMSP